MRAVAAVAVAFAVAIAPLFAPDVAAATRSLVGHIVGREDLCGGASLVQDEKGHAEFGTSGGPPVADGLANVILPDIGNCRAFGAVRRPGHNPSIQNECADIMGTAPGNFECELRPSKLCEVDPGNAKLVLWVDVFVVGSERAQDLPDAKLLGNNGFTDNEDVAFSRFKRTVGYESSGYYETPAIKIDCREFAPKAGA